MLDRLHYAKATDKSANLPCGWMATTGKCKKGKDCRRCNPRVGTPARADEAMVRLVKEACTPELLAKVGADTPLGRLA